MAKFGILDLINSPLAPRISGTFGDVVIRSVRGKTIICKRPVFRPTNDTEVLRRRERFSMNTKLAKCINDNPECKFFWSEIARNKMSSYNAIIKANYKHVSDSKILSTPYLMPYSYQLGYYDLDIRFDYCELIIKYSNDVFDFFRDFSKEKFIKVVGVIYCENNICQSVDPYCFKNVSSRNYPLSETGVINMSVLLDSAMLNLLKQYSRYTLFFAFVSSGDDLTPLNYASTFTQEFKIP